MNILVVLGMAVALAMDCFAAAMGMSCGPSRLTGRQIFRLALFFGLFQFGMPLLGWSAGEGILSYIQHFDHWVAFGLLAFVGLKMIRESLETKEKNKGRANDRTRGFSLIVLSVATSIDALAVGLSLSILRTNILFPAAIIGVTSFALTVLGANLGPMVGKVAGKRSELAGGIILILIGVKIIAGHL